MIPTVDSIDGVNLELSYGSTVRPLKANGEQRSNERFSVHTPVGTVVQ
jgi:hypothetical protein